MQKDFGNECMSKTQIKEWYNRFKGGRTSVHSDSCSGRPSTTKTLDNIERVRLAIEGDRRLTVRELENDLAMALYWAESRHYFGKLCCMSKSQCPAQQWHITGYKVGITSANRAVCQKPVSGPLTAHYRSESRHYSGKTCWKSKTQSLAQERPIKSLKVAITPKTYT